MKYVNNVSVIPNCCHVLLLNYRRQRFVTVANVTITRYVSP